MRNLLRKLRSTSLLALVSIVSLFGASNASAQTITLSSATGGGSVIDGFCFSMRAIDSIEIKRVGALFYTNAQGSNWPAISVSVFYKFGDIATTTATSYTTWTKAFDWSGTTPTRYNNYYALPVDMDLVVPANQTVTIAIMGDGAPHRSVHGSMSGTAIYSNTTAVMDCNGRQVNYTASNQSFTFSGANSNKARVICEYVLAGDDISWTGNLSGSWNTGGNWSTGNVPTEADFVTIPAGTANDCTLSSTSKVRDMVINAGATLEGGSGTLTLNGKWENKGTFDKGTSSLIFASKANQVIDDTANDFNTVVIQNGRATVVNAIANANSTFFNIQQNGELAFAHQNVDLSGNVTFNNGGKFVFGASGVQQTVTVKNTERLRGTIIDIPGSSDRVTFVGSDFYFDTLELEGNGDLILPDALHVNGTFTTNMGSSASITSVGAFTGGGDWYFNQAHAISVNFDVPGADIFYGGSGSTTLTTDLTGFFEHDGSGTFTLNGNFDGSDIDFISNGRLSISGDFDGSSFSHQGSGSVTIDGEFKAGEIYLDGSGSMTIEGETNADSIEMSGTTAFSAEDDATTDSIIQEGRGQLSFYGDLVIADDTTLEPDGGFGTVYVEGDLTIQGDLEINGDAQVSAINLRVIGEASVEGSVDITQGTGRFDGDIDFDGAVTTDEQANLIFGGSTITVSIVSLSMSKQSELNAEGTLIIEGTTTLAGDSLIDIDGNLTFRSHVNNQSSAAIEVGGIVTIDGSASAVAIALNLSDDLKGDRILFNSANGVKIDGTVESGNITSATPGMVISNGTEVELEDGSTMEINAGYMQVDGTLTSTAGSGVNPPKVIGGSGAASQGTVTFGATSTANLDGLTFERIGNNANAYAVIFESGSTITKLDYVNFPDSASTTAIIALHTRNVVATILNPILGGLSPKNIDASASADIKVKFENGSGALYGKAFETDPQQILFWDESPVVLIQDPEKVTVAYVGRAYSYTVPVVGGNAPYSFSLANKPDWLEIDQGTGELMGTPADTDIDTDVTFDVIVQDSTLVGFPPNPLAPVTRTLRFDVEFPPYFPVEITTEAVLTPNARADEEFSYQIDAIDGREPYLYELVGAQSWMNINQNGEITGKPPLLFEGPLSFSVRISDDNDQTPPVTKLFSMLVESSGYKALKLDAPSDLGSILENSVISGDLQGIDGDLNSHLYEFVNPPRWQNHVIQPGEDAIDPANWLMLDSATGKLSGVTPIGIEDYVVFTVRLSDERTREVGATAPSATKTFTFLVEEREIPTVSFTTQALLDNARQGELYIANINVKDGRPPFTFSLRNAPSWLSINSATGRLQGIPVSTFSGFLNFIVVVNDTADEVTKTFALEVERTGTDQLVVSTPPLLFAAEAGLQYEIFLAASGGEGGDLVWSLVDPTALPEGLTLTADGRLFGTPAPTATGVYEFDVRVAEVNGSQVNVQRLQLNVATPNTNVPGIEDNTVDNSLPDRGPSGGCAVGESSNTWLFGLVLMLIAMLGLRATRRNEA